MKDKIIAHGFFATNPDGKEYFHLERPYLVCDEEGYKDHWLSWMNFPVGENDPANWKESVRPGILYAKEMEK